MHDGSVGTALPPPVDFGARLRNPSLPAASLEGSSRIAGFDAARAVAVLGMIVVNSRQILLSGSTKPLWFVSSADFLLGRPAVLFVVLAGIGLSLMSKKAILSGTPEDLAKVRFALFNRSIVLYVMGLAFMRWWGADILHFYGLFLSAGALLLTFSARRLWGMITVLLVLAGVVFLVMNDTLPSMDGWFLQAGMAGAWFDDLFIGGCYPMFPWFGFLLVGLWFGRLMAEEDGGAREAVGKKAFFVFIGAELLGRVGPVFFHFWGYNEEGVLEMLFMLNSFPMSPLFAVSATAGALMILSVVMALPRYLFPAGIWRILQNTGKLSLSIYVGHVFFFIWLYTWLPVTFGSKIYPIFSVILIIVFCVLVPIAADIWIRRYGSGPLEWLLRRVAAKP